MTTFTIRLISELLNKADSAHAKKQKPIKICSAHPSHKRFQSVLCFCIRLNPAAFVTLIPDEFYKLLRQSGLLKEVRS